MPVFVNGSFPDHRQILSTWQVRPLGQPVPASKSQLTLSTQRLAALSSEKVTLQTWPSGQSESAVQEVVAHDPSSAHTPSEQSESVRHSTQRPASQIFVEQFESTTHSTQISPIHASLTQSSSPVHGFPVATAPDPDPAPEPHPEPAKAINPSTIPPVAGRKSLKKGMTI